MSNSNTSDDDRPVNPYAVDEDIDANDQPPPQGEHQSGRVLKVIAWITLLIISPVLGAVAFFFTCLGIAPLSELIPSVPIAAGILTLIATGFLATKGLINTLKSN
ncbi:hypothetical protein N9B31_00860 [Mariniblastus sp.]|mgnify:CR=1 FL=1|nr:hypothetical protein [bacterium]MDA7902185.1 hypothetical protein [Mariniblastus sp.]MDA7908997.1 hypothetical protein [bacterium]